MTGGATVEGSDRLRLFYGLPLPPAAARALASWQAEALDGSEDVRRVARDQLHVTLAFLGSRPRGELDELRTILRAAAAGAERPRLAVRRYRETERVAMLVLDDRDGHAAALQARLASALADLGIGRRERRPWLAHVTVARFRRRPGLRPPLPAPGTISPSEAALYHSLLRPSGAQYEVVEAVPLGG